MSNAVISLIALAIMLTVSTAVFSSVFDSNQTTAAAFIDTGDNAADETRASVAATAATAVSDASRTSVDVTVANTGKFPYGDLRDWHVTAEYLDAADELQVARLAYAETAADNAWTLQGIYLDASALTGEYVSQKVLNEGEEMIVRLRLNPAVKSGSTGRAVVVPPVGAPASIFFNG